MGSFLSNFTNENSQSDFCYTYARYSIYIDLTPDEIDINHIVRGPFNQRISIYEINEFVINKMIEDLTIRINKSQGKMKRALIGLRIELRKSLKQIKL